MIRILYTRARELVVLYEGMPSYRGVSGRDMETMIQGIYESIDDQYIEHRISQVVYHLGQKLIDAHIPLVHPIGRHAVFLDAKIFLAQLKKDEFPAQTLAAALYPDSGVWSMERLLGGIG
ncbi:hypothetical protein [Bacillus cereus]|uniref:hypothetical protein n=1 Tax=Bacillus cereus TaxID=1396 RepID=UPI003D96913F